MKAYTKGEHVLRFEAIVHNTAELRTGKVIERFGDIVAALSGMLERFVTTCDCVHAGFIDDQILERLARSATLGTTRVGGLDLNKARQRAVASATLALAGGPNGFGVADLAQKVQEITANPGYTSRQAAYDLRKLRAHDLAVKPEGTRRYVVPPDAARTLTGVATLRDEVLLPVLAGLRDPSTTPRQPSQPTPVDLHYENLRREMTALLKDLGIAA